MVDPGLQAERTRLSWGRTALSFAAIGGLLLHVGTTGGGPLKIVPGIVGLCGAAMIYLLGVGRYRATSANVRGSQPVVSPWPIRAVSALTVVVAALALTLTAH